MQNDITLSLVGWIISFVGAIIILCGALVSYIFTRHVRDNDRQFSENRDDHKRIFCRIDDMQDNGK